MPSSRSDESERAFKAHAQRLLIVPRMVGYGRNVDVRRNQIHAHRARIARALEYQRAARVVSDVPSRYIDGRVLNGRDNLNARRLRVIRIPHLEKRNPRSAA